MRWSNWGYTRTSRRARKKAHQRKRKKDWWKEKAVVWQRNSFSKASQEQQSAWLAPGLQPGPTATTSVTLELGSVSGMFV